MTTLEITCAWDGSLMAIREDQARGTNHLVFTVCRDDEEIYVDVGSARVLHEALGKWIQEQDGDR